MSDNKFQYPYVSYYGRCNCGCYIENNRKEDCYFYVEDHDMGATIPWCCKKHCVIESCEGCSFYISKSDADKIINEHFEGEKNG